MCESKIWKIIIFHNLLRNKWNFLYDINRSYLVQDPWVKGHNEDIENDPKENRYGTLNTKSTSDKEYSHKRYSVKKRQVSFVFSHRILWLWNLLIKPETCLISLNQYNNWPRHLPSVHVNRFFLHISASSISDTQGWKTWFPMGIRRWCDGCLHIIQYRNKRFGTKWITFNIFSCKIRLLKIANYPIVR